MKDRELYFERICSIVGVGQSPPCAKCKRKLPESCFHCFVTESVVYGKSCVHLYSIKSATSDDSESDALCTMTRPTLAEVNRPCDCVQCWSIFKALGSSKQGIKQQREIMRAHGFDAETFEKVSAFANNPANEPAMKGKY